MFDEIFASLEKSGFRKEEGGVLSTGAGNDIFMVWQENDTIYLGTNRAIKDKKSRDLLMDKVESIAGRYKIPTGGYREEKLYVALSKPTDRTVEEIRRIRFLISNLRELIKETLGDMNKEGGISLMEQSSSLSAENKEDTDIKLWNKNDDISEEISSEEDDLYYEDEDMSLEDELDLLEQEIADREEESKDDFQGPIYRATATRGSSTYGAYGYTKDGEGRKNKNSYVTNEGYFEEDALEYASRNKGIKKTREMEKNRFYFPKYLLGIAGAIMGTVLSLIIIGVLHKFGIHGSYIGFVLGMLIYIGYIKISQLRKMEITMATPFIIIGSFILLIIMNGIDISEDYIIHEKVHISFFQSLKRGFMAFFDNGNYVVLDSWVSLLICLLTAFTGFLITKFIMERYKK